MPDIRPLLKTAQCAALKAGRVLMKIYHSNSFATTQKKEGMPVTKADLASDAVLQDILLKTGFPVLSEEGQNYSYQDRKDWEVFWLVDPLDGTKEFTLQREEFTINIALVREHRAVGGVVYEPCHDRLYVGSEETGVFKLEHGSLIQFDALQKRTSFKSLQQKEKINMAISRSHLSKNEIEFAQQFSHVQFVPKGSALKFILLLEGKADIYPRFGPTMEWDTAAAHAILNASSRGIYQQDLHTELSYNKPDFHNPSFIAF